MMPAEVVSTKGQHEHGTIGTFKAADTKLPVIYTVTVNRITKFIEQADNPEFKWGEVAVQGNFEGWAKELKALPKTIKKTPFQGNNHHAIRYTFTTDGTLKPGLPRRRQCCAAQTRGTMGSPMRAVLRGNAVSWSSPLNANP